MKRVLFLAGIFLLVLFAVKSLRAQHPQAPGGNHHYSIITCSSDISVTRDCYSEGEAVGVSCVHEAAGVQTKTACYVLIKES